MRLGEALNLSPSEARIATMRLLSEGPMGAPRWNFDYSNFKNDPSPDALILGTYQHPTSGNELVGGINLHYLDRGQVQELQRALPRIMRGRDLKQRYEVGSRVLPNIFDNYYRTYRSDYVHAVQPSELPYWYDKKTRGQKAQKTKRQKDMERQAAMQRQGELRRQALQQVGQPAPVGPRPPVPPSGPGLGRPRPTGPPPVGPPGRRPVSPPMAAEPDSIDAIVAQQKQGEQELQRMATLQKQRAVELAAVKQQTDAIKARQDAQRKLERERTRNLQQLEQPNPELAAEGDPLAVESITYWSPVRGRYVTESVAL